MFQPLDQSVSRCYPEADHVSAIINQLCRFGKVQFRTNLLIILGLETKELAYLMQPARVRECNSLLGHRMLNASSIVLVLLCLRDRPRPVWEGHWL